VISLRRLCLGATLALPAAVFVSGCRDTIVTPHEDFLTPMKAHDVNDCLLSASFCADLDEAIQRLENDIRPECQAAGEESRARFDAAEGGYVPGDSSNGAAAYVLMRETEFGVWVPVDENVYVK
jgi:hypothetical protein